MKLVSFLMPTRNSHDWLRKALFSIKSTSIDFDQVEILLRIDDDDTDRIKLLPELIADYKVKVVIGPRGLGYRSMGEYINDLVRVSTGEWCWLYDDDCWLEGDWQSQLSTIQSHGERGPVINTEIYKLGSSTYSNVGGQWVGLMVPREFCFPINHINPPDRQWFDVAREKRCEFRYLGNVALCHEGRPRIK